MVAGALPQPPQLRISSPGKGLLYHPAGVPFRKFDEEVLRTLRVPSASPLPRLDSLLGTVTRAGGGPPLPALRCAQRGASVATGGCARVRGGGGGRPRPFGMLPRRGREAARRDHQPQLVYELMTRDTSRVMKGPWFLRGIRIWGGCQAHADRALRRWAGSQPPLA